MSRPDCTVYAGFDVDVYLFILCFLAAFILSFCCCCLKSKQVVGELPTHEKAKPQPVENPASRIFCGDEFLCCRKHNSCDDQSKRPRSTTFVIAVVVRFIVAVVLGLLLAWLLLTIIFAAAQQSLMYPAESSSACTPCTGDLATISFVDSASASDDRSPYCCDYDPAGYLNVARKEFLTTAEGDSINWWWIPGNASYGTRRRTILYSHGSGRNLASAYRLQRYHFLASIGLNVLTYDYAGYGSSTCADNVLSDVTAVRSAKAVVAMLTDGVTIPEANVSSVSDLLALGRSMGTGVTTQLVEDGYEFRGVLLQSPFASYSEAIGNYIASALSRWVVIGLSGGDTLDNVDNIASLTDPLYESATRNDDFVRFEEAEQVFDAAVNVPDVDKEFVDYTCYAHDDDLSPTEMQAMAVWIEQFRLD